MSRRLVAAALLALAATLSGCHREAKGAEVEGSLAVTNPVRRNLELHRDFVAQVRAIKHIEVRALERGYLQSVFVDEGQSLQVGQRMFQILPLVYQAEVKKAEAEAERSSIELGNTSALAEKNVVSKNELAMAKANFAKAQAELALASTHRSLTELKAPFAGIVGRFRARQGSLIDEGDLLTTLSDNSTMWVYFNVAEPEYLRLKADFDKHDIPPVRLLMANGELFDQAGKVETIEADFDNETGTIAFRATFPNPKGLLRHGETGKVRLPVAMPNALVVPQKATFDVLDKKFVFVVDENHVVHSRAIEVSAELPQLYVVKSGLDVKETILLDGIRKVHDGATITTKFESPEEAMGRLDVPAE